MDAEIQDYDIHTYDDLKSSERNQSCSPVVSGGPSEASKNPKIMIFSFELKNRGCGFQISRGLERTYKATRRPKIAASGFSLKNQFF